MTSKQRIGAILGLTALVFAFSSPLDSLPPDAQCALGLAVFALIFWTTEPLPLELSSLILLLLFPATGLLPFAESFAPFSGKTIWLIFAGMVLSLGITETGLGERLAAFSLRYLGRTPFSLLFHLHLAGLLASFLIPSGVVRVLLLMPIGISLADHFETPDRSRLNAAVLLSLVCGTYFGGCGVLTGSVPNLVVAGQLERTTGQVIYWATWLQWMFPLIGLVRTTLSLAVIWFLFGRKLEIHPHSTTSNSRQALSPSQRRIIAVLLLGVSLWATDFAHRIPPAYVALFLVILYVIPTWGPLPFSSIRKVNFTFLFYIAALFSLGSALQVSGFNARFIAFVTRLVDLGQYGWLGRHLAITFITVPLDFLMDIAAVAGVVTPTMLELGQTHGLGDLATAMSVGMATTLVFLPYQAAPFMVAYSYRKFNMGQMILAMSIISILSLIFLCPLNVAYWRWLGLI